MDIKLYKEIKDRFTSFLIEKKLRRTEERYRILSHVCSFPGHFDIIALHEKLQDENYHVSKATLYNTVEVLLEAGLIVKHQVNTQAFQYELRSLAENHLHLVCEKCGNIREIKNTTIKGEVAKLKTNRFVQNHFSLYIYGICSKCRYSKKKTTK